MNTRLPTYFVSHGGGPWPWMKDQWGNRFAKLEASLQGMPRQLGDKPKAVLMVSGHWEEPEFTLSSSAQPGMLYDYYGFPEHTYHVQYPAPGSPELAQQVQGLLEAGGMTARLDGERGFDHGTFTVMAPLYPQADVPVVQLSMKAGFNPQTHIDAGKLLAPLRDEGVLIVGSGLSYHNLRMFNAHAAVPSRQFDDWLQETLVRSVPEARHQRLLEWSHAPGARIAHPREDQLLPLMVAVGAAWNEAGTCVYHEDDFAGGITVSSFRFG
jgi:aromatic ring-opening dioxygenase catalytic subunit (LigB family)